MRIRSIIFYLPFLVYMIGTLAVGQVAGFATTPNTGNEASGAYVTIEFASAVTSGTISYTVIDPSTCQGQSETYPDYNLQVPGTKSGLNGVTSFNLDLEIENDTYYEVDETITIFLTGSSGDITIDNNNRQITVTISDNDDPPSLYFGSSTSDVNEGTSERIYVKVDNTGTSVGVTAYIDWAISDNTTSSLDHGVSTSGLLTFIQGNTQKYIDYRAENDVIDENDENFTITIGGNTLTYAQLGSQTTHIHTILDNDNPPEAGFTTAAVTYGEGSSGGDVTYTVTVDLSAGSGIDNTSVGYAIGAASTADADDYNDVTGSLIFAANDQSESFTFDIYGDLLDEPDTEKLIFYLTDANNLAMDSDYDTLTITITDDDAQPTVTISGTGSGDEDVVAPDITVTLSAVSGRDVSVTYGDDATGTATAGTDYTTFAAQTLTIPAGSATNTFSLDINDDSLDEPNETIVFSISAASLATLGTTLQQTYTITDDDDPPTCGFSLSTSTAAEGDANATHTVTVVLKDASGNTTTSGKNITFNYAVNATDGGTASGSGVDYTFSAADTTIPAGVSSIDLSITIIGDNLYENNETIILAIDPDNSGIGNASDGIVAHTVTIQEDDSAPKIQFTQNTGATGVGNEFATNTLTIEIDAVSSMDATVSYSTSDGTATAGTDYTALTSQTATVLANQTETTISLATLGDALDEDEETIFITLTNSGNSSLDANNVMTFTINDDDPTPTVTFSSASTSGSEAVTSPSLTVNLSAASGRDLVIGYAVVARAGATVATPGGIDYSFTDNAAYTISAGSATETIGFTIIDDDLYELDQTIVIELTAVTNVDAGAASLQSTTYTIEDDETAPNVDYKTATSTAAESDGIKTVTLRLSEESEIDVKVTITDVTGAGEATSGSDYNVTLGLVEKTIPQYTTELTFDVELIDDAEDEDDEDIVFGITGNTNSGQGTNTTHTITMSDSDPIPSVGFSNADATGSVQTVIEAVKLC